MNASILFAMVGGTTTDEGEAHSRKCGLLEKGYCVPLAATPNAKALAEAVGEDELGQWFADRGFPLPTTGGLWVLDFWLDEDDGSTEEFPDDDDGSDDGPSASPENAEWRHPTMTEVCLLLLSMETNMISSDLNLARSIVDTAAPDSALLNSIWLVTGALV